MKKLSFLLYLVTLNAYSMEKTEHNNQFISTLNDIQSENAIIENSRKLIIDSELWAELLPELKTEILKIYLPWYIFSLFARGKLDGSFNAYFKSFNQLKKELIDLKTSDKLVQTILDNLFTQVFILNLANQINVRRKACQSIFKSYWPISFYQVAKILLNREKFRLFEEKFGLKAKNLGLELHGSALNTIYQASTLDLNVIKLLIEKGADLDTKENGKPLLFELIDPNTVDDGNGLLSLIYGGANLDFRQDHYQTTAIHQLAVLSVEHKEDYAQAIRTLIKFGANPNLRDRENNTALMFAVHGNDKAVESLLEFQEIELNVLDNLGTTALLYAIIFQKVKIDTIKALLEKGADPTINKSPYHTAYGWAVHFNDIELQNLLWPYISYYEAAREKLKVLKNNNSCIIS